MWRAFQNPLLLLIMAVLVVFGTFYFACIWPTQQIYRSFNNLERNAKRVVTGTQLQAWATGLLSAYPTNFSPRVSELGTNFPSQLLGLYHKPPSIDIYQADTNCGAHVLLWWGGGFVGFCGFEIGASNYVRPQSGARTWQPGVYFLKSEN